MIHVLASGISGSTATPNPTLSTSSTETSIMMGVGRVPLVAFVSLLRLLTPAAAVQLRLPFLLLRVPLTAPNDRFSALEFCWAVENVLIWPRIFPLQPT